MNLANVSVLVWQSEIRIWDLVSPLSTDDDFDRRISPHGWALLILRSASPPPPLPAPAPPAPPALSSLCVSDTVCYMRRMPECSVPTSAGTGDVWSIPLSPGNRHVRSPPPGAGAGAEGREWVETSSFFVFFSSYLCTNKHGHVLTQGLSMKLLVVCVTSCNKCVMN